MPLAEPPPVCLPVPVVVVAAEAGWWLGLWSWSAPALAAKRPL